MPNLKPYNGFISKFTEISDSFFDDSLKPDFFTVIIGNTTNFYHFAAALF